MLRWRAAVPGFGRPAPVLNAIQILEERLPSGEPSSRAEALRLLFSGNSLPEEKEAAEAIHLHRLAQQMTKEAVNRQRRAFPRLRANARPGFDPQCDPTLAVIARETRPRWTFFAFGYPTALAWLGAVGAFNLGMWITDLFS